MDPNPLQNAKNHRVKGVGRDLQSPTPAKQPHNSTGGPGLPQRTRSPPGQPPPPHQLHLIQRYRHEMSAIPPRAAPSAATHASWRWRSRWSRWGPTTPSSSRSTARWTPGASAAGAYCGRRGGRLSAAPLRPRGAPRGDAAAAISPPASSIPPPRRAARPPFSPLSPPRAGDAAAPAGGTGRTPRPEAAEPRSAPAPIPAPRSPLAVPRRCAALTSWRRLRPSRAERTAHAAAPTAAGSGTYHCATTPRPPRPAPPRFCSLTADRNAARETPRSAHGWGGGRSAVAPLEAWGRRTRVSPHPPLRGVVRSEPRMRGRRGRRAGRMRGGRGLGRLGACAVARRGQQEGGAPMVAAGGAGGGAARGARARVRRSWGSPEVWCDVRPGVMRGLGWL